MRLLVTRPEPDALKLAGALEELGHEATVEPLLSVSFEGGESVELDSAQALIATSRNALRAIKSSPALAIARALPLFAVGKATAAEARALGFETVVTGAGTGAELVAHIVSALDPAAGLVVHLAGETVAVNLGRELEEHGFRVIQPVVYRMLHSRCVRQPHHQAWPRCDDPPAAALLPVACRSPAIAAVGRRPHRDFRGPATGRIACPH
jgi:uroporphyrinogen-III synthase